MSNSPQLKVDLLSYSILPDNIFNIKELILWHLETGTEMANVICLTGL